MHFSFAVKVAGQFQGTLRVTDTDYVMDVPFGFVQKMLEGKARGWEVGGRSSVAAQAP